MKKKKILNIFVTMFIASNLMTNFIYANPVGTETEITDLNESDESDEHDTSDMPDSNDGFNDGSDDIHYDGNEDYSFLNDDNNNNENESQNLGILTVDDIFKNKYSRFDGREKTYYNNNLDEKIKDYLKEKNIDFGTLYYRDVKYDKKNNLFYINLGEKSENYNPNLIIDGEETKYILYIKTSNYYLSDTLSNQNLLNKLNKDNYKTKILNSIKREYSFKKIEEDIDTDVHKDSNSNLLYIYANATTQLGETEKIKIYLNPIKLDKNLNSDYNEKFNLSEDEILNKQLNNENSEKLKNLIKEYLNNPLINNDLEIEESVEIKSEIFNNRENTNKIRYYVTANSSYCEHKIYLEEKDNGKDLTDYDDISNENVDNLPYFYQSREVFYTKYYKGNIGNVYETSLKLHDIESFEKYIKDNLNETPGSNSYEKEIYFDNKMAYISYWSRNLHKVFKIPVKGPEKLIFDARCLFLPKEKEIPDDAMNLISNWYSNNIINIQNISFKNKMIQSEIVDGKTNYYYDIEITKNNGTKKEDKLYLKTNLENDNKENYEYSLEDLISLDSYYLKNNSTITENEKEIILKKLKDEFSDNIMNGVDHFEFEKNNINHDDNGYFLNLKVNTLKNETFNVKLYVKEQEYITLKSLIPLKNININKLYINNDHSYVYQFDNDNDYGIKIEDYIKNNLEYGEKIQSIQKTIVNGKQALMFTIEQNGNTNKTINVIIDKETNIDNKLKFGGEDTPILLSNDQINRQTNENDKENILKMLKQMYPAAIKDINIVSNISMNYVYSHELGRNFLVDTPYVIVQIIPYDDEINENINVEKYKDGFESYDDLIGTKDNDYLVVFVNESPLPKPACPPSMVTEIQQPYFSCTISNSSYGCGKKPKKNIPVNPDDYTDKPNPKTPTPNEDVPHLPTSPSDLPKPNNPSTHNPKTPNTVVPKEPNTVIPKEPNKIVPNDHTQITIINNKSNEDVTNKNNPTTLSETKTVTRNIKTGDNLFFMLSLFSGMLSLFSFISIYLNKRKSI